MSSLAGDSKNAFRLENTGRKTHVRLRIYPDGGVARLRIHGYVRPDWDALRTRKSEIDVAAAENGGAVIAASDQFFGHRQNLVMPGLAADMSDGWETRRRRGPGHDWCIVSLGAPARITRAVVDTSFFRGNYPESCTLEGGSCGSRDSVDSIQWQELLADQKLQPHTRHEFVGELGDIGEISHVRMNIFPDGGVSRLRLFGWIS